MKKKNRRKVYRPATPVTPIVHNRVKSWYTAEERIANFMEILEEDREKFGFSLYADAFRLLRRGVEEHWWRDPDAVLYLEAVADFTEKLHLSEMKEEA